MYQLKLGRNFNFESLRKIYTVENQFELIFAKASPSQTKVNWVWPGSAELVIIIVYCSSTAIIQPTRLSLVLAEAKSGFGNI